LNIHRARTSEKPQGIPLPNFTEASNEPAEAGGPFQFYDSAVFLEIRQKTSYQTEKYELLNEKLKCKKLK